MPTTIGTEDTVGAIAPLRLPRTRRQKAQCPVVWVCGRPLSGKQWAAGSPVCRAKASRRRNHQVFEVAPFVCEWHEAIEDGWLVLIRRLHRVEVAVDFSQVRTSPAI